LQIELTVLESGRTSAGAASAKDLALAGEAIYLRYEPSRRESEQGYRLCERALAIDPNNVRALGILAGTDHGGRHRHAKHRPRC